MFFYSFLNILTLQVGTFVLSVVFLLISCLSFGINNVSTTSTEIEHWYVGHIVVCLFVILMVITGLLMFFSAYNQNATLCYATLGLLCFTALFWVVLTVIPFVSNPSATQKVCVRRRCAESFWLASLHLDPNPHNTSSTYGPKSSTKPSDYPDNTTLEDVGLESSTMPADYSDYTTIEDVASTDYSDNTPGSTDYSDNTPGSTDYSDYTTVDKVGPVHRKPNTAQTIQASEINPTQTSNTTGNLNETSITKVGSEQATETSTVSTTNTITSTLSKVTITKPGRKKRYVQKEVDLNIPEQDQLAVSYKIYKETRSIIAKNIKEQETPGSSKNKPLPTLKLIGIIFFALINVFFFIFSILIVSSYSKRIKEHQIY